MTTSSRTVKVLRVAHWDMQYENHRTRELQRLTCVLIPNHHDGEAYTQLMSQENGLQTFGAWVLILQVASKCPVRGLLVKDSGEPLNAASLAIRTRAKEAAFIMAIPVLLEIGWLEEVTATRGELRDMIATYVAPRRDPIAGRRGNPAGVRDPIAPIYKENKEKRREGKGKGRGSASATASTRRRSSAEALGNPDPPNSAAPPGNNRIDPRVAELSRQMVAEMRTVVDAAPEATRRRP